MSESLLRPLLPLLPVLTFIAGTLVVIGIFSLISDLFLRDRSRFNRRIDDTFRARQRDQIRGSALFKKPGRSGFIDLASETPDAGPGAWERLTAVLDQSGLNLRPERLLVFSAVAAVAGAALLGMVTMRMLGFAVGTLVGAAVPIMYVMVKRKARLDRLMGQLPDAFDLMARCVRAGQTIAQSIQAVSDEFDQPIAAEFAYCFEQQNLGLSPELALRDLARRTGLLEIKIFVVALLVQQQSGGNLAEMLERLAAVIRDRARMKAKVQALTAEGRFQAGLLLIMPIVLMVLLMLLSTHYSAALAKHPNMIYTMLVSEAIGAVWIRRIINYDF